MKMSLYQIMLFYLLGYAVCGEHYIITDYELGKTLNTGDSLYMLDGGLDSLTLYGDSTAIIEDTFPLQAGSGGIWFLSASNSSSLEIRGGEINHLDMSGDAMATLSGGTVLEIESSQQAKRWDNDNGVWVHTPHISIVCLTHVYDDVTKMLTGNWMDGNSFSIQLMDVASYSPTIENIQFIPEPATVVLMALGGVFLRKK